jgi:hypothetical protein
MYDEDLETIRDLPDLQEDGLEDIVVGMSSKKSRKYSFLENKNFR